VRRLGRVRWITKFRVLRRQGSTWAKRHPLRALAYVAWDPEVDTFTYDLANATDLELALARVLDVALSVVRRAAAELDAEPELNERLAADVRLRPRFKRRLSLPAHHRSAWVITRVLRPECVVETGILDGLGSRVILAALQRNADEGDEGDEGELISFDVMPGAGALVPDRLRARWRPVYEPAETALRARLRGRRVGLLAHDSDPSAPHQRLEFGAALDHGADRLVLMTVWDAAGALRPFAEEHELRYEQFQERPREHFYRGRLIGYAARTPGA
jgi:Methyltransferase domain